MGHVGMNGEGRPEKPRYDVPQGVGVKNGYEADLTNRRRGSGQKKSSCVPLYRTVAWNGCGIRFLSSALLKLLSVLRVNYTHTGNTNIIIVI